MRHAVVWSLAATLAMAASGTAGAQTPEMTPGKLYPTEIRYGGWTWMPYALMPGTATGDWPSCGITLDRRARAATIDVEKETGFRGGPQGTQTQSSSHAGTSCAEFFVPQAACTVKVFLESGPIFSAVSARGHAGASVPGGTYNPGLGFVTAPATDGARAGCYLQLRNWSGRIPALLIAWPPA
jgi:hypothetical protein